MSEKFRNKYRIESIRLQNWDYRWDGKYFITICTHKMQHLFGSVENGKMILSNVGVLADVFWHEIKNHAKNVELHAFVVMPNHVHGVIELKNGFDYSRVPDRRKKEIKTVQLQPGDPIYEILQEVDQSWEDDDMDNTSQESINTTAAAGSAESTDRACQNTRDRACQNTYRACPVSGTPRPSAPPPSPGSQRFQNIGKNSISSIIGSYKSAVSKHAHRLGYHMEWMERFHDSILRTDLNFRRVEHYIHNNPKKWKGDHFHEK